MDVEDDSWEWLEFAPVPGCYRIDPSFAPFHQLSSSVKSLKISSPISHPHVSNLIRSFPLLEDLHFHGRDSSTVGDDPEELQAAVLSPTPPALNGTHTLCLLEKMVTPRSLLHLPGGLHFENSAFGYMGKEVSVGWSNW